MTHLASHFGFPDTLRELRPLLGADPDWTDRVHTRLEDLAAELAGYDPSSARTEQTVRRARIKLFRETRAALQRLFDVLELARPRQARESRRLLAPTLGELFSNTVFAAMNAGIPSGVSTDDIDRWHARYRR